jgi:hypothetical protein
MSDARGTSAALAGLSAIDRARIHRLTARLTNGTSLNYPEHRVDVRTLLDELERLREDNAHLREEKARVWEQVNAPTPRQPRLDVIAWSVVAWGAALLTLYALWRRLS